MNFKSVNTFIMIGAALCSAAVAFIMVDSGFEFEFVSIGCFMIVATSVLMYMSLINLLDENNYFFKIQFREGMINIVLLKKNKYYYTRLRQQYMD